MKPLRLLIVDDDPLDVEMFKYCCDQTTQKIDCVLMEDGVHAMEYLRNEGVHQAAVRPDIILLDLNMPLKDGRETLSEIRGDGNLKSIPVIILTSSNLKSDIKNCRASGADAYLTKPVGIKGYAKVVEAVQTFCEKNQT